MVNIIRASADKRGTGGGGRGGGDGGWGVGGGLSNHVSDFHDMITHSGEALGLTLY